MGCASCESSVTLLDLARVMKSLKKWKILPTAKKVRVVSFIGFSYDEIYCNIDKHSKKYHGHKCGVFLTRTLTNRLRPILPTIIHQSQTAVDGRKIDHTIHMLRDLIDLVDKEESQAAFIFLDQEKAFDRVDH